MTPNQKIKSLSKRFIKFNTFNSIYMYVTNQLKNQNLLLPISLPSRGIITSSLPLIDPECVASVLQVDDRFSCRRFLKKKSEAQVFWLIIVS